MLQEKNNYSKTVKAISLILSLICMCIICWLSSRTADESALQSGKILEFFIKLFGDGFFTDFIVRKSAHCLEFTGLALLLNFTLLFFTGKIKPIAALILTSLYAVTDEVHQLFVPGRSCEVFDWIVDTFGASLGILSFLLIIYIADKLIKKGKN